MIVRDKNVYLVLASAGALPFVAGALLLVNGVDALPYVGATIEVVTSYSVVIVAFMSGTVWAHSLGANTALKTSMLPISNGIVLCCWFAHLAHSVVWTLAAAIICFMLLLIIDHYYYRNAIIEFAYFRVRLVVTMVVVLSLSICLMLYPIK